MRHQEISLAVGPISSDRRALLWVLHYVSSELRITSLHNSRFCIASNKSLRKQVCDSSIGQAAFNSTTVHVNMCMVARHCPKVKEFSGSAVRYQSSCLTRSYVHS
jgi:hypothetical protein